MINSKIILFFLDVLAIVKSAAEVQSLTARATGRELRKRDLTLVDMSDSSVTSMIIHACVE